MFLKTTAFYLLKLSHLFALKPFSKVELNKDLRIDMNTSMKAVIFLEKKKKKECIPTVIVTIGQR